MFGPIRPRVYICSCGWKKYVYGSRSDVLQHPAQIPPRECEKCASELKSRAPNFLERVFYKEYI